MAQLVVARRTPAPQRSLELGSLLGQRYRRQSGRLRRRYNQGPKFHNEKGDLTHWTILEHKRELTLEPYGHVPNRGPADTRLLLAKPRVGVSHNLRVAYEEGYLTQWETHFLERSWAR